MAPLLLALALLAGCQDVKEIGGGLGVDLTWVPGVGRVYACSAGGQEFEFCFDGSNDELADDLTTNGFGAAICGVTQRHLGPCLYCCGDDCGRGANAFNGSWCQ